MRKKLSLDKSITELARRLKEHIGSNGKAHLPVSTDMAGFMTPDLFKEHVSLFKSRTPLNNSKGTDILSLPIGNYAGYNWLNYPGQDPKKLIGDHTYISVLPSNEPTRRLIVAVASASGMIWTRTVNDTYDVNNGWVFNEQRETLWEGNSKMTSPVTLSTPILNPDGSSRFSGISVDYTTDTNNHGRQYGTRYDVTINTSNENNTLNVMAPVLYEAQIVFPTSTTAKMEVNKATVINTRSDGAAYLEDVTSTSSMNILRISGLR